ncbi:Hydroxymethylpyrimidine/phosphomethylpyrimidine kinase [Chryseobacterium oranimense G311]|uniref:hydroxymethylpyrimidine/phosphomethylpyrimidine kinase n=1 Tax=Chryseobacterium oranimense TaxID=421058 RepID=UPI0005339059|nr:hydroxymethylpyrimidine/phosphomethylpyrimidine kinase [Chryseobacterium oranimense]CEJ71813.1 Hydroxymethylpyrimidine/phosphomethylpyrimidine kinase [Chryseobacterium oranimense G311]
MQTERPFVMTIAGFDPSGGAGVLADIKTFEQLGVMGLSVCTAMTVQTESRCLSLEWRPLDEIITTISILMKDYPVEAVKIGIVKDATFLEKIVETVRLYHAGVKIIWDPVLKSTSEFSFFDLENLPLLTNVLKKIDLITPNYNEYNVLQKYDLFNTSGNSCAVLVKGGHRNDKIGTDILICQGKETSLEPDSHDSSGFYSKHGSGCVLSSAIAAHLAKGETLEAACRKGKLYIEKFLKSNPSLLGFHST